MKPYGYDPNEMFLQGEISPRYDPVISNAGRASGGTTRIDHLKNGQAGIGRGSITSVSKSASLQNYFAIAGLALLIFVVFR